MFWRARVGVPAGSKAQGGAAVLQLSGWWVAAVGGGSTTRRCSCHAMGLRCCSDATRTAVSGACSLRTHCTRLGHMYQRRIAQWARRPSFDASLHFLRLISLRLEKVVNVVICAAVNMMLWTKRVDACARPNREHIALKPWSLFCSCSSLHLSRCQQSAAV